MKRKSKMCELWRNTVRYRGILLLALPGLALLIAFNYLPMVGIVIPFKRVNYALEILGSDWAGLSNFQFLFSSGNLWRAIQNTLLQNALFIVLGLVVSVALALLLQQMNNRRIKLYMTALFVPYFLSWVVVGYVAYAFLNTDLGVVNRLITNLTGAPKVNWYMESRYWRGILVICYLWKNVGYFTILYYAALIGIDVSYYEAAGIDGATKWQQIWYISLPQLMPTIMTLLLLQIGKIFFSDFGLFYFVPKNSGALYAVTDVIDTFVFRSLQTDPNIGMTAAAGLCQTVAGFALVIITNAITKKIDPNYGLF